MLMLAYLAGLTDILLFAYSTTCADDFLLYCGLHVHMRARIVSKKIVASNPYCYFGVRLPLHVVSDFFATIDMALC